MNTATFALVTEINAHRKTLGFAPLSQYEFSTPKEWRTEHRRVMADKEAGRCSW